ncbi:glycosyltransferase family 87 protein [Streptomyces sp. NBC_01477]|uniref:glycosyltransferase family 87 protein n=1 Tax=Streptomyces sp. NBC_01477 TaxID=2976015 RepID=UPI002E364B17|nr:glycosyltransferase 87 family protein [Streptomyces sp. NBC_01477]
MTSVRDREEDDRQEPPVRPTDEDSLAATASELIGGPAGKHAEAGGHRWWNALRVMVLIVIAVFALGMVQKVPCYNGAWFQAGDPQYIHACYSDIPHLYHDRGFAADVVPYFDRIPGSIGGSGFHYLEYPVLTGLFMEVASWLTPHGGTMEHRAQIYWIVNSGMLLLCAIALVVAVARTNRRRPWDGLFIALSPALALSATINWDLFAVALASVGLLLWSRSRPLAAGVLIGLATAAKLYPVLLLLALFLLCLRAGRMRAYGAALGGAVGAWLVVNLPVILLARSGWAQFYDYSRTRGVDYGSVWLIIMQRTGNPLSGVSAYVAALLILLCAGIAALTFYAPRRPRLGQITFLVVAALIVSNKVYSPQYVLWLLPLAVLARPRWRDLLIWQGAEVLYYLAIWMQLAYVTGGTKHHGLSADGYHLAVALHLLGVLYLSGMVIRDIMRPEHDVLRQDGEDDPVGGVLDGAEDSFVLGLFPEDGPPQLTSVGPVDAPADASGGLPEEPRYDA